MKASTLGNTVRARRDAMKRDALDRDNERLRIEVRALREEVERDRDEREDLLGALKASRVTKVVKRRRGWVRTLVVGAGAYVLGTKAGRARYDEIVHAIRSLRDRGKERLERSADQEVDDLLVVERGTTPSMPPATSTPASTQAPMAPREHEHGRTPA
jgi:hypothetical protein